MAICHGLQITREGKREREMTECNSLGIEGRNLPTITCHQHTRSWRAWKRPHILYLITKSWILCGYFVPKRGRGGMLQLRCTLAVIVGTLLLTPHIILAVLHIQFPTAQLQWSSRYCCTLKTLHDSSNTSGLITSECVTQVLEYCKAFSATSPSHLCEYNRWETAHFKCRHSWIGSSIKPNEDHHIEAPEKKRFVASHSVQSVVNGFASSHLLIFAALRV